MKNLLTVISLLITLSVKSQSTDFVSFVNKGISSFSVDSFNLLFEKKINEYRKNIGVENTTYDKDLLVIAQDQSDYCILKNKFTHYQSENPSKNSPWDRGEFFGYVNDSNEVFSENLLSGNISSSMSIHYKKGINFYDLLSIYLIESWKQSESHNSSMISPANCKFAVSISVKDDLVIACLFMITMIPE